MFKVADYLSYVKACTSDVSYFREKKRILLATCCHVCAISKLGVNIQRPVSREGAKLVNVCG